MYVKNIESYLEAKYQCNIDCYWKHYNPVYQRYTNKCFSGCVLGKQLYSSSFSLFLNQKSRGTQLESIRYLNHFPQSLNSPHTLLGFLTLSLPNVDVVKGLSSQYKQILHQIHLGKEIFPCMEPCIVNQKKED